MERWTNREGNKVRWWWNCRWTYDHFSCLRSQLQKYSKCQSLIFTSLCYLTSVGPNLWSTMQVNVGRVSVCFYSGLDISRYLVIPEDSVRALLYSVRQRVRLLSTLLLIKHPRAQPAGLNIGENATNNVCSNVTFKIHSGMLCCYMAVRVH